MRYSLADILDTTTGKEKEKPPEENIDAEDMEKLMSTSQEDEGEEEKEKEQEEQEIVELGNELDTNLKLIKKCSKSI